jgi:saccharopine dehydrogenase (NAD+, L-lysine-forming)
MEQKRILILGGYGGAGFPIGRGLLKETDVRLILAGRNLERAEEAAERLNAESSRSRVAAMQVDVAEAQSLANAFRNADTVLVCSPTSRYAGQVAQAALSADIDYLDILYPQKVVSALRPLEPAIQAAGRCFITQAGCHPGLPAALVRYAASHFPHLKRAIVGMAMSYRHLGSPDSVLELMEEVSHYQAYLFREGEWRKAGYKEAIKIDFGPGFGVRPCVPLWLEEMRTLPDELHLEEAGLYAAGFNWFVDWLLMPLAILFGRIGEGFGSRLLARGMVWGMRVFSRPPFGIVFKLQAEGEREGRPCLLEAAARHDDAYQFTAVPVVACLLQYLDGSIARPGLWMMGQLVDPARLIADMMRMGIEIEMRFPS